MSDSPSQGKNSSQGDNSDDLISQLARLMADDAQAGRPDLMPDESKQAPQQPQVEIASQQEVAQQEPLVQQESLVDDEQLYDAPEIKQPDIGHVIDKPISIGSASADDNISTSDPIADLISAQLSQSEAQDIPQEDLNDQVEVKVENNSPVEEVVNLQQEKDIPQDDNFTIPPIFGMEANAPETQKSHEPEILVSGLEIAQSAETRVESIAEPVVAKASEQASQNTQNEKYQYDDPIIDIENLIGDAVRAGLPQEQTVSETAVDTNANIDPQTEVADAANAAQESILAASEQIYYDDEPKLDQHNSANIEHNSINESSVYSSPKKSFFGGVLVPSLVGVALLAVGFGIFYYFGSDRNQNTDALVLNADTTPTKIAPSGTNLADNQETKSAVFDKISGEVQASGTEQLVSRDESAGENVNQVSRIIAADSSTQTGLANRKVRTVTVRPDGTIVNGDSARAGSETLPVDRPNVPQLPQGSITQVPNVQVATNEVATNEVQTEQAQVAIAAPAAPVVEQSASVILTQAVAPIPLARPSSLTAPTSVPVSNSDAVNLIATNANANIIINSNPAPIVTSSTAPAYVQLSSQRSEETAKQSLTELSNRFSSSLGGAPLEIQRASLGDKGVYYRVRVPANSLANANQICANIKQAGGECFVRTD